MLFRYFKSLVDSYLKPVLVDSVEFQSAGELNHAVVFNFSLSNQYAGNMVFEDQVVQFIISAGRFTGKGRILRSKLRANITSEYLAIQLDSGKKIIEVLFEGENAKQLYNMIHTQNVNYR